MPAEHWEYFRNGADIGVRGFGPTKEAAFAQAARATILLKLKNNDFGRTAKTRIEEEPADPRAHVQRPGSSLVHAPFVVADAGTDNQRAVTRHSDLSAVRMACQNQVELAFGCLAKP
jgi:hypothetical protein